MESDISAERMAVFLGDCDQDKKRRKNKEKKTETKKGLRMKDSLEMVAFISACMSAERQIRERERDVCKMYVCL